MISVVGEVGKDSVEDFETLEDDGRVRVEGP